MLFDDDEITIDLHDCPDFPVVRQAIEIVHGSMWERDCDSAKLVLKYNVHRDQTITIEHAHIFVDGARVYGDRKRIEADCELWLDTELRAQAKREEESY